jgi:recombination protein RecR
LSTYPSKILEEAVREFSRLPGIGNRSALRLVLHLLKENPEDVERFGRTIQRLKQDIRFCRHAIPFAKASFAPHAAIQTVTSP